MSVAWPVAHLGEVLKKSESWVTLAPDVEYQEVTVRLWGRGVTQRRQVTGAEIGSARRLQVRPRQFILSRIDARNGAFGLIPQELDGAVVSNDFPVFDVDENRMLPEYLGWMSRTVTFVEACKTASEGTTNRVRLKEETFLRMPLPLPPLAEQRRIVAKIDHLAAKVEEARCVQQQAKREAETLLSSVNSRFFKLKHGWKVLLVNEFCEKPQYGYTASATDQPVGPRFLRITDIQNGRVIWDNVPFCICPDPSKYLLKPNDLVFARTGATTGKSFLIHECPEAVFASYLIRLRVREGVLIDYLYHFFQSPSYWTQIADEKQGTGQPNLNGSKLEKLKVPVPPLPEQRRIIAELDALSSLVCAFKKLQNDITTILETMMPAILDQAFKGEL